MSGEDCLLIHRRSFSHCVLTWWKEGWRGLWGFFPKCINHIFEDSALMTWSPSKDPTSSCHHIEGLGFQHVNSGGCNHSAHNTSHTSHVASSSNGGWDVLMLGISLTSLFTASLLTLAGESAPNLKAPMIRLGSLW